MGRMKLSSLNHHTNGLPRILLRDAAVVLMRELLAEGGRLVWAIHSQARMEERDISATQVLNVLQRGHIVDDPVWNANHQNWEFGMQEISAGELIMVRVAIDVERLMGQVVLVITAFVK